MEGLVPKTAWPTFALLALVVLSGPSVALLEAPAAEVRTPRAPIVIDGDANFTTANGVVSGSGAPSNPFVIRGWEINVATGRAISILNTRAAFRLQDVAVSSDAPLFNVFMGVFLSNVSNARLERLEVTNNFTYALYLRQVADATVVESRFVGNGVAIVLETTSRVAVSNNQLSDNRLGGISVLDSSNVTVIRNTLSGNGGGLALGGNATDVLIAENHVDGGYIGIAVDGDGPGETRNVTIAGNRISGVNRSAVYLNSVENVTVQGNDMADGALAIEGFVLAHYNSHTVSDDNRVNGRPISFYQNCADVSLSDVTVGQLIIVNCRGIQLGRVSVDRAEPGIVLAFVENAAVLHSTLSDAGIDILNSRNVTVSRSIATGAGAGVFAREVDGLVLGGNVFEMNGAGVLLFFARNVTLSGNVLTRNVDGIDVESTDNATFVANVIAGNNIGIYAPFPIGFQAFENSFVDNAEQVFESPFVSYNFDGGYPVGGTSGPTTRDRTCVAAPIRTCAPGAMASGTCRTRWTRTVGTGTRACVHGWT